VSHSTGGDAPAMGLDEVLKATLSKVLRRPAYLDELFAVTCAIANAHEVWNLKYQEFL
jgi:hypothetical protein